MPPSQPASKQTITIILVALTMAVFVYIGVTYLMPAPAGRPEPPMLRTAFLGVALISAVLAVVMERAMLDKATTPQAVQTAVVVLGALAEVSAVLGLVYFLIAGRRDWVLFGLSLLSCARLLLRLPEYHRLMDKT